MAIVVKQSTQVEVSVQVSMPVADFFSVVNTLRDTCGCVNCKRIADSLLGQLEG